MAVNVKLRKMLHTKGPEYMSQTWMNAGAGSCLAADARMQNRNIYYMGGTSNFYLYDAEEDAWLQLTSPTLTGGSFTTGACMAYNNLSFLSSSTGYRAAPTSTPTNTREIPTNITISRNLSGLYLEITDGPGLGYYGKITSNTLGPNSIITLDTALPSAVTTATRFQIYGGSVWFFNPGTSSVALSVYDVITSVWTTRSVTGLPTSWGTAGTLIVTSGRNSNLGAGFLNGTASSSTTTTLIDSSKTLQTNAYANNQIRILTGTGAGQVRKISSNTSNTFTVSTAWAVSPDTTSTYRIEGDEDYIYLAGNNAVTLYRYSVSANAWSTLTPSTARAGASASGATFNWIDNVTDPSWVITTGTPAPHYSTTLFKQNGRYIYSFRGGGTTLLDVYDIALNTWVSGLVYNQIGFTLSTGTWAADFAPDGRIFLQKDNNQGFYFFDVASNTIKPHFLNLIPASTTVVGQKSVVVPFREDSTTIWYQYSLSHTRSDFVRWLII